MSSYGFNLFPTERTVTGRWTWDSITDMHRSSLLYKTTILPSATRYGPKHTRCGAKNLLGVKHANIFVVENSDSDDDSDDDDDNDDGNGDGSGFTDNR